MSLGIINGGLTNALTDYTLTGVSLISLTAIVTDLKDRKIYNWLTFPGIVFGVLCMGVTQGWGGVVASLLGMGLGLLLTVWMFALRVMGAGDVKLMMAFGAWGGAAYIFDVFVLALLIGGVISFGILVVKGRLVGFLKKLYLFFISLFVKNLKVSLPKVDRSLTLPFGVPLAIAAVWTAYSHPLVHWGVQLW